MRTKLRPNDGNHNDVWKTRGKIQYLADLIFHTQWTYVVHEIQHTFAWLFLCFLFVKTNGKQREGGNEEGYSLEISCWKIWVETFLWLLRDMVSLAFMPCFYSSFTQKLLTAFIADQFRSNGSSFPCYVWETQQSPRWWNRSGCLVSFSTYHLTWTCHFAWKMVHMIP